MEINLYYWNNGVGVVNDALLLSSLLSTLFCDITRYDLSTTNDYRNSDIGIYIQNVDNNTLQYNTAKYNTAHYITAQHRTLHHAIAHHITLQHGTIEYNTEHHSTAHYTI